MFVIGYGGYIANKTIFQPGWLPVLALASLYFSSNFPNFARTIEPTSHK